MVDMELGSKNKHSIWSVTGESTDTKVFIDFIETDKRVDNSVLLGSKLRFESIKLTETHF